MFTLVIDARTLDRMRLPPDPARWGSAVRCRPTSAFTSLRGQAQAGKTQRLRTVPEHVNNAYRPASYPRCRRFENHRYSTGRPRCHALGTVVDLGKVAARHDTGNCHGFGSDVS